MIYTVSIGLVLSTNILIETVYAIIGRRVGIESAGADQTNLIENINNKDFTIDFEGIITPLHLQHH